MSPHYPTGPDGIYKDTLKVDEKKKTRVEMKGLATKCVLSVLRLLLRVSAVLVSRAVVKEARC